MDDTKLSKQIILPIAVAVSIFGLILTIWTVRSYRQESRQRDEGGYFNAQGQAEQVVTDLNNEIKDEMLLVQDLSDKLSLGELHYDQVNSYMAEKLGEYSQILGLGVGFVPYAYKKNIKLHAPYIMLDERGEIVQKFISYDYTDPLEPSAPWYLQAMEQGKGVWLDPYYGKASDDLIFDPIQ